MQRKYFGTDGVRGRVGEAPITPEIVMRLGYAAGKVLVNQEQSRGGVAADKPTVLIGKDTRISGYLLEAALQAGFAAAGVDVLLSGPLPTPAVAYLTRALRLAAGVVISASHNPYEDNGIKFFSAGGTKLPDPVEIEIERSMENPLVCAPSADLGKARRLADAPGRYIEFCKGTFPNELDLKGLKLVVDAANGAGYHVAGPVFHELGAEVIGVANSPDGVNINAGVGATKPGHLQAEVVKHGADLGIALDGDGDRLIMVDAEGRSYDGDQLLYVIAAHRQSRGELKGGIVGTLMSNLGFEQALAKLGIALDRVAVGDRYVLERLLERRWHLGGENSGHIICLDKHSTGDAIVSALQVLTALRRDGKSLADLSRELTLFPQQLINVRIEKGFDWRANQHIQHAQREAISTLGAEGRILLRASGTEPVLRVMVEARAKDQAESVAKGLADAVAQAI